MKELHSFYRYWAKSEEGSENRVHLLPYHSLDVAACGKALLEGKPGLLARFVKSTGMGEDEFKRWACFLLSIHDLGKFSSGFQGKRPDLVRIFRGKEITVRGERHDVLGYRFCVERLPQSLTKFGHLSEGLYEEELADVLEPWICSVTGHHGRPPCLDITSPPLTRHFSSEEHGDVETFVDQLMSLFFPGTLPFSVDDLARAEALTRHSSWLMAGLAVLADWLGSNTLWFPYRDDETELSEYWVEACERAKKAVGESGVAERRISHFSTISSLFRYVSEPTSLQALAENLPVNEGPRLIIMEEVTGGGKTEAALTLAHRIMEQGGANGVYMALPTMATANAMYGRVEAVYRKFFDGEATPSLVLAHSARRMVLDLEKQGTGRDVNPDGPSASETCSWWLADSRKKSLLADVGVGTIDQALLSVLPIRHQSLRLLGLSGKVLVVDEVHASDPYIHRVLCTLLRFHASNGSSAILLSATLPLKMRSELLKAFSEGLDSAPPERRPLGSGYPMLTHLSADGLSEHVLTARPEVSRRVEVRLLHTEDEVIERLIDAAESEKSACWVRNTVKDAVSTYQRLIETLGPDKVTLFHARFTLGDRLGIERRVLEAFGPDGKESERQGKVLVATQVVEQSLDLDFDFMVSDLAPVDLIIQRAGRLHRHPHRKGRGTSALCILSPEPASDAGKDWFTSFLPGSARVYAHHGRLWLTARWLARNGGFRVPEDSRDMIEAVYSDDGLEELPPGLLEVENSAEGGDSADRGLAILNSLNFDTGYTATMENWQEDTVTPTRIGEPTVTVRLAIIKDGEALPWNSCESGHDWELSQVQVWMDLIAEEDEAWLPEVVDNAKASMPDEGRYTVVIPLEEAGGVWKGRAKDSRGRVAAVVYDPKLGLSVEKGEKE